MAKLSFFRPDINEEDCWRSIVLFGRNVASYKFALAASLLDLTPASGATFLGTGSRPTTRFGLSC